MMRKARHLFVLTLALGLGSLCGATATVVYFVVYASRSELERSTLLAKLNEETTLYYDDEVTRIGSLFEARHRDYVAVDDVPAHVLNAIVAAEDQSFYEHYGVDPLSIGKAFLNGLMRGGKFRRGASTLTQQTVKNILGDWEASFSRKFRELIKAIQLEQIYSKQQILEFYVNQFHVSGNGNGIGIAARYYFDKKVSELTLLEGAFIAGSLKGPGKYNPFIKNSREAKELAMQFAFERKNYVLGRMFDKGWISQADYDLYLPEAVPFRRGEFRSTKVSLVSLIRGQLARRQILDALGLESIDGLNVAGMKVFTTLDHELQRAAQFAMRKNLSQVETILSGFSVSAPDEFKFLRDVVPQQYAHMRVTQVMGTGVHDFKWVVSFGIPEGEIAHASIVRLAKLLDLPSGKGYQHFLQLLYDKVHPGDVLFGYVRELGRDGAPVSVEVAVRPEVSGGMLVLDRGQVRAVVSGFDTLGYNRAIHARRQAGSLFKSLVFFSALQLGWSMLDPIDNDRSLFHYQRQFYFPRADHRSPYSQVSMLWTGAKSENLASVALGANLLAKTDYPGFEKILEAMGLMPHDGESPADYHYRIEKRMGVSLDLAGIRAHLLRRVTDEVVTDLIFQNENDVASHLRKLWWGDGYLHGTVEVREAEDGEMSPSEKRLRLDLLLNNYGRLQKLAQQMRTDWERIASFVAWTGWDTALEHPEIMPLLERFRIVAGRQTTAQIAYQALLAEEQSAEVVADVPLLVPVGRPLNALDVESLWGAPARGDEMLTPEHVYLMGAIPARFIAEIPGRIDELYAQVMERPSHYQLERYFNHHDFRISVGLNYTLMLARECGVFSPLEPVLSFPLGSSDVTSGEIAKLYQTFIDGKTYRFYPNGPANQTNFIKRIEDRAGNVLFQAVAEEHQLVNPEVTHQMKEILRRTVTHGTAQRAKTELYIPLPAPDGSPDQPSLIRVPAFGKTGTTNSFQTSYFAGFVPYPVAAHRPLSPSNSYVIAAYVGYDDNRVMSQGRQRIYGGRGALPAWTDFVKELLRIKDYAKYLDPLDLDLHDSREWPLDYGDPTLRAQLVDLPQGIRIRSADSGDVEGWTATDLDATGETFQDFFAGDAGVRSVLWLPPSLQQQYSSRIGIFAPFSGQAIAPSAGPGEEEADDTRM